MVTLTRSRGKAPTSMQVSPLGSIPGPVSLVVATRIRRALPLARITHQSVLGASHNSAGVHAQQIVHRDLVDRVRAGRGGLHHRQHVDVQRAHLDSASFSRRMRLRQRMLLGSLLFEERGRQASGRLFVEVEEECQSMFRCTRLMPLVGGSCLRPCTVQFL